MDRRGAVRRRHGVSGSTRSSTTRTASFAEFGEANAVEQEARRGRSSASAFAGGALMLPRRRRAVAARAVGDGGRQARSGVTRSVVVDDMVKPTGLILICSAPSCRRRPRSVPPAAPAAGAATAGRGHPGSKRAGAARAAAAATRADDKRRMTRISYRRATPGELGEDRQADGDAQQRQARAGRRAQDRRSTSPITTASRPRKRGRSPSRPSAGSSTTPTPPTSDTADTCSTCHSIGARDERAADEGGVGPAGRDAPRLLSARRQPADERRPGLPPHAAARPSRAPTAVRRTTAIRWRRRSSTSPKTFPLKTPEWAAWSATMQPARLDGTWAISGYQAGKGADRRPGRPSRPTRSAPDDVHHRDALHGRAHRRSGDAHRHARSSTPASSGAAAATAAGRSDNVVARSDDRRSRLAARCRAAGSPAATTRSAST